MTDDSKVGVFPGPDRDRVPSQGKIPPRFQGFTDGRAQSRSLVVILGAPTSVADAVENEGVRVRVQMEGGAEALDYVHGTRATAGDTGTLGPAGGNQENTVRSKVDAATILPPAALRDAYMDDPTHLIQRAASGDLDAYDALFSVLRREMESIAESLMRQESREVTVQEGVLISECYLRLRHAFERRGSNEQPPDPGEWGSREQFLRYAASAMRSIVLDAARRRGAQKRGNNAIEYLSSGEQFGTHTPPEDLLFFDEAIEKLGEADTNHAALLELVTFGGLSPHQAGMTLGLSRRRADAAWAYVRAWILREAGAEPGTTGND